MRIHRSSLLCLLTVISISAVTCGSSPATENAVCRHTNERNVELEKKVSSLKSALQLVRDRIAQVKRDKQWQTKMLDIVQTNENGQTGMRSAGLHSKRDVSRGICTNMRDRVHLVNGTNSSGRLEVMVGEQWSPVSQTGFGQSQASIVCTTLGFNGTNARALTHDVYGDGGQDFLVDESCRRSVGVMCGNLNSHIRLVNGSYNHRGRVEIEIAGQWGSICHNSWNRKTAQIACRMLGFNYEYGAVAVGSSYFGVGSGPVWLQTFNCQGDEPDLLACSTDSIIPTGCSHTRTAGVICDGWRDYPVRLMDGKTPGEGRVEVQIMGQWGTVSKNDWDTNNARVVCRMLGYENSSVMAVSANVFGPAASTSNMPVWLDYVNCNGNENHILECDSNYPVAYTTANHDNDVGVACHAFDANQFSVRLANGSNSNEGRVEVMFNGVWGTICHYGWDVLNAQVVCRQLGKNSTHAKAWNNAHFGPGSGLMLMDSVDCSGTESSLADCSFPGFGLIRSYCTHNMDAGVTCA